MTKSSSSTALPAAIYARISRDVEGERLGVERQEADCRAMAERLGWDVVDVFIDNDISAYSGKVRPQYRAMLDAVRGGQIKGIIAWHSDRLHRRTTELEEFVSLVELHGIQVETVSAGSLDLSTASGRMIARMLGAAAQGEVERTRERVKRAKTQAAADGKYRGGPRPFGFEKDGVTVREKEAALIREATAAILAGRSLAAVTREWNAQGLTGTFGKPWTYNNLRDMLIRPRNAGLVAKGLPGRKGRKTTDPDWSIDQDVIGPAAWPAIVPEDQWRALISMLTDPARRRNQDNRLRWLGSGIYLCGVPTGEVDSDGNPATCGAPLRAVPHGGTGSRKGQRRYLYRCTARAHLTVSADSTDEYIREVVAEAVRDPRVANAMTPGNDRISGDRARRTAIALRLEGFETDYAAGRITGAQLQKATATATAELAEIDARLAKALQHSTSASVLRAADPGAAFLAAPLDIQRAVLGSVLRVEIQPATGPRGSAWTAERIKISPV